MANSDRARLKRIVGEELFAAMERYLRNPTIGTRLNFCRKLREHSDRAVADFVLLTVVEERRTEIPQYIVEAALMATPIRARGGLGGGK